MDSRGSTLRSYSSSDIVVWEGMLASEYSPKVVGNDEVLYRRLDNPIHWNSKKNTLNPTAIKEFSSRGMSVNRLSLTNRFELLAMAYQEVHKKNALQAAKPNPVVRYLLGFAHLSCDEVRTMSYSDDPTDRLFAIFDTALEDTISHADVFRLGSSSFSDEEQETIARRNMWDYIKGRLIRQDGTSVEYFAEM